MSMILSFVYLMYYLFTNKKKVCDQLLELAMVTMRLKNPKISQSKEITCRNEVCVQISI